MTTTKIIINGEVYQDFGWVSINKDMLYDLKVAFDDYDLIRDIQDNFPPGDYSIKAYDGETLLFETEGTSTEGLQIRFENDKDVVAYLTMESDLEQI